MPGTGKRISVYLDEEDHEMVAQRATRAGMKLPAYLRRIACGQLPPSRTKDFVTHCIADVAGDLDAAAEVAKEKTAQEVMLTARDRLRTLLKQHIGVEGSQ